MKFRLAVIVLLALPLAGFAQNYVTLYADCYYKGVESRLSPGRYTLSRETVGSRNLSSIKVPAGLQVTIYDAPDPGTGAKMNYTADVMCLFRSWNDKAMSVVVEYHNAGNNTNSNSGVGVTVYKDNYMTGEQKTYASGSYDLRYTAFDVNITSLKVPQGWTIVLYDGYNFTGNSYTVTEDFNNLKDANTDWNDRTRSIKITARQNNGGGYQPPNNQPNNNSSSGITVYKDNYMTGEQKTFAAGSYNFRNTSFDLGITSLRVPEGWTVVLYEDYYFRGNSYTVTADFNNLKDAAGNWNDRARSMKVTSKNNGNGGYQPNNNVGVTIYNDSRMSGQQATYTVGSYSLRNTAFDANITSLKVPEGWSIVLYDEYEFRGNTYTVTADFNNLKDAAVNWNDRARSFTIKKNR